MNEVSQKPLVSIGLPVYNEERFLEKALESLLSQDYGNLELIVSDNCSTDRTPKICEAYAARDRRVRYIQNATNVGAVKSFNRIIELVQGKYFMLAGGHDLWHPTALSRCVSILEAEPGVVIAYSGGVFIDMNDQRMDLPTDQFDTRGLSARERYIKVIRTLATCSGMYGVIRTHALRESEPSQNIWGPDFCLLGELALKGEFALIPEPMFFRRLNRPDEEDQLEMRKRRVLEALDPSENSRKAELALPELFRELRQALLRRVRHSELSQPDKLRAYLATLLCFEERFGVRLPGFLWRKRVPGHLRRRMERYRAGLPRHGRGTA